MHVYFSSFFFFLKSNLHFLLEKTKSDLNKSQQLSLSPYFYFILFVKCKKNHSSINIISIATFNVKLELNNKNYKNIRIFNAQASYSNKSLLLLKIVLQITFQVIIFSFLQSKNENLIFPRLQRDKYSSQRICCNKTEVLSGIAP